MIMVSRNITNGIKNDLKRLIIMRIEAITTKMRQSITLRSMNVIIYVKIKGMFKV